MSSTLKLEADFEDVEDEKSFLQAVREWERKHRHVQLAVSIENATRTRRQAEEIVASITPGFPYKQVFIKEPPARES